MRKIKFRGYDGMDWAYGTTISYDNNTDTWHMIPDGFPDDDWIMVGDIGQYTGLRDIKGQEIYEGDIVRYYQRNLEQAFGFNEGDNYLYKTREIIYREQGFNIPQGFIKDLQVIGNIYEK
jgi:hypothetical protein